MKTFETQAVKTITSSPPVPDPTTVQTLAYEPDDSTFKEELNKVMMTEDSWWKVERFINQDQSQQSGATSSSSPALDKNEKKSIELPAQESGMSVASPELHAGITDDFAAMDLSTPVKQPEIPSLDETKEEKETPAAPEQPPHPVEPVAEIQPAQPLAPPSIEPEQPSPSGMKLDLEALKSSELRVENGLERRRLMEENGLQDPAHLAQQRMAALKQPDEVEVIPESPKASPVPAADPEESKVLELAKASIVSALEGMLKEGFDLDGAIARLKDEENAEIPVVSRIKQFENKKHIPDPGDEPVGDKAETDKLKPTTRGRPPKAKGKAKAKAKAKVKGQPKRKAAAKAKQQVQKAPKKEESEDQVGVPEPDKETPAEPAKTEKRKTEKKEKEESDGVDPPTKKAKAEPKSFARRPCPTTSPAKDKWVAIMQTFRGEIQQKLKDGNEKPSKWEDMGYKSYIRNKGYQGIIFYKEKKIGLIVSLSYFLAPMVFNPTVNTFQKHWVDADSSLSFSGAVLEPGHKSHQESRGERTHRDI